VERLNRVASRLVAADLGASAVSIRGRELRCAVNRRAIPQLADLLRAEVGAELELLAGADTRQDTGAFTLVYRFATRPPGPIDVVVAEASVPSDNPSFPSLATQSFAGSRYEREIQDLFGLRADGHPDPRRLPLHQFWPDGYHALRRDAALPRDLTDAGQAYPFRRVEGEGIFEITVGPVHAGIIEPGHFRFSVEGETIVNLETRLYFVHKGIEKLFEQLPFGRTVALAERISGDTSVGHAVAYCQAIETLAAVELPRRAALLRVLFLELERLYNHVGDVGAILNDTGYAFAHAHCGRLREDLLRLNARVAGHRLLRGVIIPGGVSLDVTADTARVIAVEMAGLMADFEEVTKIALGNTLVLERLQGTGRLFRRRAEELQVVGLVARASGIDADARRDAPFAAYGELEPRVVVYREEDVWARTMVRIEEAREAARLVGLVADRLAPGPLAVPIHALPPRTHAFGLVEGWRGPILHWVRTGPRGELTRVKIKDPSFVNWPALEYAVLKNIVPDFPLCNKSFNLTYSGNDL
jgi:Ni,Fe-hydrogenase III large subunit/Ni,Fe-hydrogenase III component G